MNYGLESTKSHNKRSHVSSISNIKVLWLRKARRPEKPKLLMQYYSRNNKENIFFFYFLFLFSSQWIRNQLIQYYRRNNKNIWWILLSYSPKAIKTYHILSDPNIKVQNYDRNHKESIPIKKFSSFLELSSFFFFFESELETNSIECL